MNESVILCEGYYDRAFWGGWFDYLGLDDRGRQPGRAGRIPVLDPWRNKVVGGEFGYYSKSGRFSRISPCGGRANVLPGARYLLGDEQQRAQAGEHRLTRLVINIDSDVNANGSSTKTGFRRQDLLELVKQFDAAATENDNEDLVLFGGATLVSLARWETPDDVTDGLPNQQTLERLACAALVAAYPKRGPCVQTWLDSRPDATQAGPKEFGWSHMAGWYAERGGEGFYRALWDDPQIAAQLKARLSESGAW